MWRMVATKHVSSFLFLSLSPEPGVEGDTSPGNGVASSPDGTEGGALLSDKTSSLNKAEPSTDSSPVAVEAPVTPGGGGQAVGGPEESGKGNIEEEDVDLTFKLWVPVLCTHSVVTCMCQPSHLSSLSSIVIKSICREC